MSIINVAAQHLADAGTCTQSTAAASSTSASALAANSNRKRCLILNPASSTVTVHISFGATATLTNSISLPPGFGWLEENLPIYRGGFFCITASGTANLSIFEWA